MLNRLFLFGGYIIQAVLFLVLGLTSSLFIPEDIVLYVILIFAVVVVSMLILYFYYDKYRRRGRIRNRSK